MLLTISGCPLNGECNTLPLIFICGAILVAAAYGFYKAFIEKI